MNFIFFLPRQAYYSKKKKTIKNQAPTIISSDCFAGIAYHNLGLKFRSPTINLFFKKDDFLTFAHNIKGFLTSDIKEVKEETRKHPIGELEYDGKKITAYFLHYKTFDEAVSKWNERKKRIDFSNIYLVLTVSKNLTEDDVASFSALPYKNKMLITGDTDFNESFIVKHKIFNKQNYKNGEFLRFKGPFYYKRHMDEVDYVTFLNNPQ